MAPSGEIPQFTIYPELFKKIVMVHGSLGEVSGLREVPDYKRLSDGTLRKILEDRNVYIEEVDSIMSAISQNRDDGMRKFYKMMRYLDVQDANRGRSEAANFFLLNELYIETKTAEEISLLLFEKMGHLIGDLKTQIMVDGQYVPATSVTKQAEAIKHQLDKVKTMMRMDIVDE